MHIVLYNKIAFVLLQPTRSAAQQTATLLTLLHAAYITIYYNKIERQFRQADCIDSISKEFIPLL